MLFFITTNVCTDGVRVMGENWWVQAAAQRILVVRILNCCALLVKCIPVSLRNVLHEASKEINVRKYHPLSAHVLMLWVTGLGCARSAYAQVGWLSLCTCAVVSAERQASSQTRRELVTSRKTR